VLFRVRVHSITLSASPFDVPEACLPVFASDESSLERCIELVARGPYLLIQPLRNLPAAGGTQQPSQISGIGFISETALTAMCSTIATPHGCSRDRWQTYSCLHLTVMSCSSISA
jgi:hypothetical protein